MLTAKTILEQVVAVAREHLDLIDESVLTISDAALLKLRLVDDLGLDSIQLLTLAVEVENHFAVTLDEFDPNQEDAEHADGGEAETERETVEVIETLGDLVGLIERKVGASSSVASHPSQRP